jgi:hypothetical protein
MNNEYSFGHNYLKSRGIIFDLGNGDDGKLEMGSSLEATDLNTSLIKFWCSFYLGYTPFIDISLQKLKELEYDDIKALINLYNRIFLKEFML